MNIPFPPLFQSLESGERRIIRNILVAVGAFLLVSFIVQLVNGPTEKEVVVEEKPLPVSSLESQDNFVFRPRFRAIDGEFSSGSAFVALTPFSKKPVILTALHILGPAGGYYRQIDSTELRSTFTGITLREMFTDEPAPEFPVSTLEIPDALPLGQTAGSLAGDVAAFRIEDHDGLNIAPARLASGNTPLSVGSVLHLVYRIEGSDKRLHKATIIEIKDKLFVYAFENKGELKLRGSAGAPLLNEAGEVAAVHLGNGRQKDTNFGLATPVSLFRSRLELACRAPVQVTPETGAATAAASPPQPAAGKD